MDWAGCLKQGWTSGAFEVAGGAPGTLGQGAAHGVLTESMTRLRDEILALRHNRQRQRNDLAESAQAIRERVAALRLVLASDRAGARRAWCGLHVTCRTLKKD